MKRPLNRRQFLATSARGLGLTAAFAAAPGQLSAVEPLQRPPPARLLLSLAAYSFREFFKNPPDPGVGPERRMDLPLFIDFCATHGCSGAELTSYYFPGDVPREFLLQLRRHAFLRGVAISGTAVGNTFTVPSGPRRDKEMALVKTWIKNAAILGAPHIRVFAGNAEGAGKAEAQARCIAGLEECAALAGEHGIFLGLENHGGIVAEAADLLEIIRAVRSPWVGINLDTGNFHTADPYADIASCAPYAVNVQIKAEISPRGKKTEPADLRRLIGILKDVNYQGYVALEYESAEDPFVAVPRLLKQLRPMLD